MAFSVQPDGTIKADTLDEAMQVRAAILMRAGGSKGGANRWKNLDPERRARLSAGAAASARKHFAANPGKGSISVKRGKFCLMVCIEGKARWAGSWPTRAAAEDAQRQVQEARKAGLGLPSFVRPNRSQAAVDALVDELADEEPPHAPIWPDWSTTAPPVSAPTPALEALAAVPIPSPSVSAPPPPDQPPAPAADQPREPKKTGPTRPRAGCITKRGDAFGLVVSFDGKSRWYGCYQTREAAEEMRARVLTARERGEPLPEITRILKPRLCRRCGAASHDIRNCTGDPLPPRPPRVKRATHVPLSKEEMSAAMKAGWAARRARLTPEGVAAPPAPQRARKGSPEYRAKLAAAVRAYWDRRRASLPASPAAAAPVPPAIVRAKLPLRCVRCFRVGHVDADCPKAAPAPGSDFAASNEDGKQEAFTERATSFTEEGPSFTDDDSTDLTDLVDVPEAEPTLVPADDDGSIGFNRGKACGTCGKPGHISVTCPTTLAVPAERATHVRAPVPPSLPHFCLEVQRPCPRTSCRFHLGPERPGVPLDQLRETCTLDVADRGPATLEEIGAIFDLTRERIRQVETKALERAARNARRMRMDFELPVEPGSNAPEDSL